MADRDEDTELAALRADNAALLRRVADAEALLQATIDQVDAVIYLRDATGTFTFVNDAWVRAVGLARDAVIGKTDADLFPPEVYEGFRVADRHVTETRTLHEREEHLPQDDGVHTYRSRKFPVLDCGELVALGGISFDLTTQRRAEAALRTTQSLLRGILDNAPLMLLATDCDDRVVLVGRETARRSGLSADDALGRDISEVVADAAAVREQAAAVRRTGQVQVLEQSVTTPDGDLQVHIITRFPIRDPAGAVIAVGSMAADVSDLRRAETERARLQQEALAAQEAALAELSTPVVPIADGALAVPLVGALDRQRMARTADILLGRLGQSDSRLVLIDLTGIRTVEAASLDELSRTIRAARLLGVEIVLTGTQPSVARTLIQLGVQLPPVTILQTLQHGVEYALARLREDPARRSTRPA